MNKEVLKKFGVEVKKMRKEKGLTQQQLADRVGLHRTYIGMIERSEKNITLINIERITIALGVKIKDLFSEI